VKDLSGTPVSETPLIFPTFHVVKMNLKEEMVDKAKKD